MPGMLGRTLKVMSPYVSSESGRSTKPTSGLKLGPVFLRSTIPSTQFDRYVSDAPTSLFPLGFPSDCVPAMCASMNQSLKKTSRSEEHTSELQSHSDLVCRLLLEKKKKKKKYYIIEEK